MWLLGVWSVASATEELDFIFHLILIWIITCGYWQLCWTLLEHLKKISLCFISQMTANPIVKINAIMSSNNASHELECCGFLLFSKSVSGREEQETTLGGVCGNGHHLWGGWWRGGVRGSCNMYQKVTYELSGAQDCAFRSLFFLFYFILFHFIFIGV